MLLFDTLSQKKKKFVPRRKGRIDLFVCGPTVYDYSHVGHARTYIAFDALCKYLRCAGYTVRYIQNITDVDDKIIARAQKSGVPPLALARQFEKEYHLDMKNLGVDGVDMYARATDYIPKIVKQISVLEKAGYAYQTSTGVYFRVAKFAAYGKLSHQNIKKMRTAERIESDETKEDANDFALWKCSDGVNSPVWESPWGKGRPGWHIEDTAITETEFGPQYDVHGGARDLIFPHHESEIAQMEAASGKAPLVRYWMHTGFLTIGGEKMSKSLGNFVTIREMLKTHSPLDFRMFILTKHYRSPVSYREEYVREARVRRLRLQDFFERLKGARGKTSLIERKRLLGLVKDFWKQLADDFNTPKAFAALFRLEKYAHRLIDGGKLGKKDARSIEKFLRKINGILGVFDFGLETDVSSVPDTIMELVAKRESLRSQKKWKDADGVRAQVAEAGYMIEDTPAGPRVIRAQDF